MFAKPIALLRTALIVDALVSGATGLLLTAGAGLLEPWLALPQGLLRAAGLILVPFAAAVAWMATRETLSIAGAWTIVSVNAAWVAASIGLLFTGHVSPNTLGVTFVVVQAVAVAALADVQWFGLRRARLEA